MITDAQYQRLLVRVTKLEETCNNLITAHERFITLTQINQLLTIQQTEQQDIREQLDALETRVSGIEEESVE